jgi:hypothetical protein
LVSFYLFLAITIWTTQNPERVFSNSFLIVTLLITSLTSFACVKRNDWLKISHVE